MCFFFSSRRRHTRYWRDWSSDVCSSDLVLSGGLAGNKVMEVKREKFLSHEFDPGFRSELHHKDLGIALTAGREYGVVLPVTAIVDQMLLAMKKKGWGSEDHSALLRIIEDLSQHEIES